MNKEELSVLEVVAYFGQWQRALTFIEIKNFLYQQPLSDEQLANTVNNLCNKHKLVVDCGYIALSQSSITATINRQTTLTILRQRALRIASIISSTPYIQSVILMNSVAMQTNRKESDIDFLVITAPGHLYFARALALIKLKILGLHKNHHLQAGRACLGYWLTEDNLDVRKYRCDDRTNAMWIATMVPLFGVQTYNQFIKVNDYIFDLLPNWKKHQVAHLAGDKEQGLDVGKYGVLEKIIFHLSQRKIMRDSEFANSKLLVCAPNILKMHSVDHRPNYIRKMQSILDILSPKR
ncbi:MAG: nucleotidyltransferase domain-containing protein [Patescibacteria group bacterium]|jgi:predicted nucleotidyltransferase